MELGVYVCSIICGHIDWTGNIELYKSMSLMCKTLYKAVRYGATPYVRWNTEKNLDLLFHPEKFFFGHKIRALVISRKHVDETNRNSNIEDFKVPINNRTTAEKHFFFLKRKKNSNNKINKKIINV